MGNDTLLMAKASEAKGVDPASPIHAIQPARDGSERDLNALRKTVQRASCDGCGPSGEGIAAELVGMHPAQRASALRGLQQTIGNRYVGRLAVQAKLKIGQPGDKYEQEADRVAEQVMRMQEPPLQRQIEPEEEEEEEEIRTKLIADQITPLIQREVEPEEEEKIQTKPIDNQITPLIQRQIEPEEEEEEEKIQTKPIADQITPLVQREVEPEEEEEEEKIQKKMIADQITPLIQRQIGTEEEEEEEKIQKKTIADQITPLIQRQIGTEEEEEEEKIRTKPIADQITPLIQGQIEPEEEEETVQTKGEPGNHSASFLPGRQMAFAQSTGFPLREDIRSQMESHFGSDFSHVRIHADHSAHQMNQNLQAQAFTHGGHIYFRAGYYNPSTRTGKRLLAHELTHVLQQGTKVQKKYIRRLSSTNIVQRTTLRALREIGTAFLSGVSSLGGGVRRSISSLRNLERRILDYRLYRISLGGAVRQTFWSRIRNLAPRIPGYRFISRVGGALLRRLRNFARRSRKYRLLTVVLKGDPISNEEVKRNGRNFIFGFLSFLSNGSERYRNLQQSGAIDRAFAWLNNEVKRLNLSWTAIRQQFVEAWESLSPRDLLNPIPAFRRIVNLFKKPISSILSLAGAVGMKILEFVFEGVMGAGGTRVLNILKRLRDTFLTIVKDPVRFLRNLINAVAKGFRLFGKNIRVHLRSVFVKWLFGALQGADLHLPERLDMRGIISLVLQILGLTYQRIRPRLVGLLGERTVSRLEDTFEVVKLLDTKGLAAIWQRIAEYAGNLRDQVMENIRNWVIKKVVISGVAHVATLFLPASVVIQAIRITYKFIMWFIERRQQLMGLVEAISNSIGNIASGNISDAANYIEQSIARILPLAISLLARLLNLGGISSAIRGIIERIRGPIDRAIDRVVQWITRQGRRLVKRGRAASRRVMEWWRLEHRFTTEQGERHRLYFRGSGRNAQLMIASNGQYINRFVAKYQRRVRDIRNIDRSELKNLLRSLSRIRRLRHDINSAQRRNDAGQIQHKLRKLGYQTWKMLNYYSKALYWQTLQGKPAEELQRRIQGIPKLRGIWKDNNRHGTILSKNYFKERVLRGGGSQAALRRALQDFEIQMRRTPTVLKTVRRRRGMGPNICHSRTVAMLQLENWAVAIGSAQKISPTWKESFVDHGRGRNKHAERNIIRRVGAVFDCRINEYKPKDGGGVQEPSATHVSLIADNVRLFVDKPICPNCERDIRAFERKYGVSIERRQPSRLRECGE